MMFVCVETGELFSMTRKPRILPAINPETGRITLLPCTLNRDGKIKVGARNIDVLRDLERQQLNKCVNMKTLEVEAGT